MLLHDMTVAKKLWKVILHHGSGLEMSFMAHCQGMPTEDQPCQSYHRLTLLFSNDERVLKKPITHLIASIRGAFRPAGKLFGALLGVVIALHVSC